MSKPLFQIAIPRRGSCCAQGNEPLLPGMEYHSVLKDGNEEGVYERKDYCAKCWEILNKQHHFDQALSFWKSAVPKQKEVSELPKQRELRALILLKDALKSTEEGAAAEAFVLSLFLARRRRLHFKQEIQLPNKPLSSIYEDSETEEILCVPKMPLTDLQVERLQADLAKKFA